jgi:hypothetical protein
MLPDADNRFCFFRMFQDPFRFVRLEHSVLFDLCSAPVHRGSSSDVVKQITMLCKTSLYALGHHINTKTNTKHKQTPPRSCADDKYQASKRRVFRGPFTAAPWSSGTRRHPVQCDPSRSQFSLKGRY